MFSINKNKILFCTLLLLLQIQHIGFCQYEQIKKEDIPKIHLNNLIQGHIYFPTYQHIKGEHYLTEFWRLGNVQHLDHVYSGLPVWYDIYVDDLVLLDWQDQGYGYVSLIKEYVSSFEFDDRTFINIAYSEFKDTGLENGYYEVIYEGEISLLIKRQVEKREEDYVPFFMRNDKIYFVQEEQAHEVRNKKSLLSAFPKRTHKSIKAYLKKERMKPKEATGAEWNSLVQYLNNLI